MDIGELIDQQHAAMVVMRRYLHAIPELGYEEDKTATMIRAELDRLGIAHIDGVDQAPTATIAWLGDVQKPCVALRADIDGLPITEANDHDYRSTHDGRMHACGHDGHMSILLGAAAVLLKIVDRLPVCVKLIFQPAEEGGGGAERLVAAGVLDGRIGPKVSAIFGLHGWPDLPVGSIATKPGALMAATDSFRVQFIGKGCHAAFPHLGRDPIVPACEAVLNLQQFITRELDPTEPAVLSVTQIKAGTTHNVIPDSAVFEGTARTLVEYARKSIEQALHRRCEAIATASGCKAIVTWETGYPATVNDPRMSDYVEQIARRTLGADRFFPVARAAMGGEDFSYYLQRVPGCFFLIGLCPPGQTCHPTLHSDRFDFTDAALGIGVKMFVKLVQNFSVASLGDVNS